MLYELIEVVYAYIFGIGAGAFVGIALGKYLMITKMTKGWLK